MARNDITKFAVEGGNFNVCRIKALASKVGKSCIQLLMIIQLSTDPFSIIVRGVNLESDQLRATYRHSMNCCKTLLQELLPGGGAYLEGGGGGGGGAPPSI